MAKSKTYLSPKLLTDLDFKHIESTTTFDNIGMPYYVKNSILLFYNTPIQLGMENSFMVGYGEMRQGKCYAVSFRWIKTLEDLTPIYESITNILITEKI